MGKNSMLKITQAEIDALPVEQKLELVEAIWDSIAAKPEELKVPDWHEEILDERLADENAETDTWENAKKRILDQ